MLGRLGDGYVLPGTGVGAVEVAIDAEGDELEDDGAGGGGGGLPGCRCLVDDVAGEAWRCRNVAESV
jgi:hypothetical protein